ncbi:MAG: glycosyltransferase family 2 protein [Rikenellaceae bacterium]
MKLSIVTVNFNSSESTLSMISSVERSLRGCGYSYEIIVIDNASHEADYQQLVEVVGIRLIRSEVNGGFAAANNIGFEASRGEYVMLLNNDTTIKEDIFVGMMDFMGDRPEIGILSPTIVYDREPYIVQYGGYRQGDRYLFDIVSILHGRGISEIPHEAVRCSFGHGAALMISREALLRIGAMREDYFLYFEEIDFSLCAQRLGYEIWYYPRSIVYHNASATVAQINSGKIYYNSRNRLYLATNNLRGWNRIWAISLQLGFSFPKSVLKFLIKGRRAEALAYIAGVWAFVRGKRGKRDKQQGK